MNALRDLSGNGEGPSCVWDLFGVIYRPNPMLVRNSSGHKMRRSGRGCRRKGTTLREKAFKGQPTTGAGQPRGGGPLLHTTISTLTRFRVVQGKRVHRFTCKIFLPDNALSKSPAQAGEYHEPAQKGRRDSTTATLWPRNLSSSL